MLQDAIGFFTDETHILAGMSVACGTAGCAVTALGGVADAAGTPLAEDSIFDLASLTKLMTGMLVLRLREEGLLALDAPVTRYAPQFAALGQVTVEQVLGFQPGLVTPERVDAQQDAAQARRMLFAIRPVPLGEGRAYSDMHAMVLRYVAEGAAGEGYMPLLRRHILAPLGMDSTFCRVPDGLRGRCVHYEREHRIERENWILREGPAPGVPHDPKARLLNPDGDECPGHAGLFSTRGDMVRFCQGVLRGDVLPRRVLREMARNRTGRPLPGGGWTQHLGWQCFVKHPEQYHSEIPVYEGPEAFGCAGFTGNHLSIDPERGIFALYLGNRVLNRLTVLLPEPGRSLTDYGLNPDGSGSLRWTDGERVWSSVGYVHQKDAHFHNEVAAVLSAL